MSDKEMRELDAWIAEHVMGWKLINRRAMGWVDGPPVWATGDNREEGSPTFQDFRPTTDGRAAMEVWEKCFEHPACGQPSFQSKAPSGAYWIRTVTKGGHVEGEAKTLPLAICLFAKQLFSKEQP